MSVLSLQKRQGLFESHTHTHTHTHTQNAILEVSVGTWKKLGKYLKLDEDSRFGVQNRDGDLSMRTRVADTSYYTTTFGWNMKWDSKKQNSVWGKNRSRTIWRHNLSRKSEELRYKIPLAQIAIRYFVNANQNRRRSGNLPSRSDTDVFIIVVSPPPNRCFHSSSQLILQRRSESRLKNAARVTFTMQFVTRRSVGRLLMYWLWLADCIVIRVRASAVLNCF